MNGEEGPSKVVLILTFLGVAIMALAVYASTITEPIIAATIFFAGASLLILPMTKALM